jgi:Protein of unknown function (DUF2510)
VERPYLGPPNPSDQRPVSTPAPNWYPDPSVPSNQTAQRWWDGAQWSAHTRQVFAAPSGPANPYLAAPTSPIAVEPKGGASTQLRRLNSLGYIGASLCILSIIFDIADAVGIAGVVLCAIGLSNDAKLRSAGHRATGRGWLITCLVLGGLSTLYHGTNIVVSLVQLARY